MTEPHIHDNLDQYGYCTSCTVRVITHFKGFALPDKPKNPDEDKCVICGQDWDTCRENWCDGAFCTYCFHGQTHDPSECDV